MLLGGLIAAQVALTRSLSLLRRHLWVDEIVTAMLVGDPSTRHALRAIAGGVDTNPPAYHLLMRLLRRLTGAAEAYTLRVPALLSVIAALVGVYVSVRPACGPLAALAAALALWGHPLVLRYAFEGRMYAPWLAATVWMSYALSRALDGGGTWTVALLAAASLLACTLHSLGPFAVVLVVAFEVAFRETAGGLPFAGAGVGLLAFVAWSPNAWRQNAAYSVSWAPATWPDAVRMVSAVLASPTLLPVALVAGLAPSFQSTAVPAGIVPPVIPGMAGLVFLPLVLIVLSYTFQPLLLDRYALPAVASLGVACAAVLAPVPAYALVALCGLLFWMGLSALDELRREFERRDQQTLQLIAAIREPDGALVVLFESPLELFVVSRYAPDLADRCYGLDFEPDQLGHVDAHRIGARDQMRVLARFYAQVRLYPWTAARALPRFLLVPSLRSLEQGFSEPLHRYPGFRHRVLHWRVLELAVAS